jgi:hypothetical protein
MFKIICDFCQPDMCDDLTILVGTFFHEILIIAVDNSKNPIELVDPLVNLMSNECVDVQSSILPNLGLILNNLNRFFKHEIIND